jgi:flagellar M-ring protein FliF
MNNLLEGFKKLKDRWLEMSKTKKIVVAILLVAIVSVAVLGTVTATSTKYEVLFSQMDSTDANTIITKLKSDKVAYKVDSSTNTIYVPSNVVDDLRLEYASSIKDGSTGFELFDNSSSQYGMTDQQFNVEYQRALQGELERTIKSFPEVSDARVELVMPEDSVFVQDSSAAKASVFLKLNPGQTLTKSQVTGIVALISGAVKNLPTANVQVVDDNMNLLSSGLNTTDSNGQADASETTATRNEAEVKEETELQEKALAQLEPIYGKGNVEVQVHADMNFDSIQQDSTVENNPVIVSEHDINDVDPSGSTTASGGPNDNNNSSAQAVNSTSTGGTSTHVETTKNYDTSKTETKTVTAPGDIKRLTVSVVVDGKVSNATQTSINNIVSQAIGIDPQRGDTVSIEGLKFDTTLQNQAKTAQAEMNTAEEQAQRNALIRNMIIAGVVGVVGIIGFIIFLVKRRKKNSEYGEQSEIDEIIGDDMGTKAQAKFAPIQFEEANEKSHIEKEIRNYAGNKPDQVADVVKAWLAEDERG